MPRARCVHCGAAYGQRRTDAVWVRWPGAKEDMPPYRGNGIVVKESYWGYHHPDGHGVSSDMQGKVPVGHHTACRKIWDGESYYSGSANPFCTARCALDYARKAWREKAPRGQLRVVMK